MRFTLKFPKNQKSHFCIILTKGNKENENHSRFNPLISDMLLNSNQKNDFCRCA